MTNFRLAAAVAPLAVLVASLAPIGGFASAQVTGEADPGEAEQPQLTPPTDEARQRFEQLPPEVQLGARAGGLQASWPVERTLVIAESPAAYANAIASWTLERRFPVLIDDGTPRAAWDIARFAHAFEPNRVLLFDEPGRFEAMVFGDSQPTGRRVLEEVAVASANAWGKENAGMRAIAWKRQGFTSPGLVYASEFDPAWTAALALGAGRGQPIFWLNRKAESLNAILNADAASAFEQTVRAGLVRNNAPWNQIGDDIDAVTLCLNIATRVRSEDGEVRALSDVLARNDDGSRYAWASIVPGSEAQAAYMAMSSLFLRPEKAWLFDGYADDFAPEYDVRPAEPLLEEAGLDVTMTRGDAATIDIWRALAKRGIDADFVHVNSSGMASLFNLRDSTVGYASDVPLLSRPAAVHFIHSFAAQRPGSRDTIAARWLDHGAFAFYGSAASGRSIRRSSSPLGCARRRLGPRPCVRTRAASASLGNSTRSATRSTSGRPSRRSSSRFPTARGTRAPTCPRWARRCWTISARWIDSSARPPAPAITTGCCGCCHSRAGATTRVT